MASQVTHPVYLELINKLKTSYQQSEEYFSGLYQFFEFKENEFEEVYQLIAGFLGGRSEYKESSFTTVWSFSTEKIQKGTLNLYIDHIEVFIDIPTTLSEYRMDVNSISKPEQMEYLFRHSEYEKKRMEELTNDTASFNLYRKRIEELRASRNQLEDQILSKLTDHLKSEIESLKRENQHDQSKLVELKKLEEEKQRQLELKKKSQEALNSTKRHLNTLPQTNSPLPVGYTYTKKHYERVLDQLIRAYGRDSQIDKFMEEQGHFYAGSKTDTRFLQRYIDLYKVKYEGKSTYLNYDNPKYISVSFDQYLESIRTPPYGLYAIGIAFLILLFTLIVSMGK